jgi:hypothetical protein
MASRKITKRASSPPLSGTLASAATACPSQANADVAVIAIAISVQVVRCFVTKVPPRPRHAALGTHVATREYTSRSRGASIDFRPRRFGLTASEWFPKLFLSVENDSQLG